MAVQSFFRKVMEDINNQKFRCQFCEQEFDQNTLEVHNATTHNFQEKKKEHQCEICEKIFNSKNNLQKHLKKVHSSIDKDFIVCILTQNSC